MAEAQYLDGLLQDDPRIRVDLTDGFAVPGFLQSGYEERFVPHWRKKLTASIDPEFLPIALAGVNAMGEALRRTQKDALAAGNFTKIPFLSPEDVGINIQITSQLPGGNTTDSPEAIAKLLSEFASDCVAAAQGATLLKKRGQLEGNPLIPGQTAYTLKVPNPDSPDFANALNSIYPPLDVALRVSGNGNIQFASKISDTENKTVSTRVATISGSETFIDVKAGIIVTVGDHPFLHPTSVLHRPTEFARLIQKVCAPSARR